MRYVVFTTKHHDGFSMFDTRQTDYRITSSNTPFGTDPRANVTKEVFDAFRTEGFMIGAYFSKPDWHSPDYWWPYFATPDRNPNYDIGKYPERWARFVEFTHAQVRELTTEYGPVDILWLDGGWVRTMSEEEIRERMNRPDYDFMRLQSQDIDMPRLVAEARARQPGLIVVDRAVEGPYQNYLTPEARVPDQALPHPWEVPMPMAQSWSFVPDDTYKSPRTLIHMLADVVAKGGNLLLNIGPGPDGRWHEAAYDRLEALGCMDGGKRRGHLWNPGGRTLRGREDPPDPGEERRGLCHLSGRRGRSPTPCGHLHDTASAGSRRHGHPSGLGRRHPVGGSRRRLRSVAPGGNIAALRSRLGFEDLGHLGGNPRPIELTAPRCALRKGRVCIPRKSALVGADPLFHVRGRTSTQTDILKERNQ